MEKEYVKDVYEEIAEKWDSTHGYLWKGIKEFILKLTPYSNVLDAGCGNGKNMLLRDDCNITGFDFCQKSIQICNDKKKLEVMIANTKYLPYRDNCFDATFSVAVLHHIVEKREEVIRELIRVTKPNGLLFIQVWANTVEKNKKFIHISGNDYFVTWFVNPTRKIKRYYHLFDYQEFIDLFALFNVSIVNIKEEMNNWIIILSKNN